MNNNTNNSSIYTYKCVYYLLVNLFNFYLLVNTINCLLINSHNRHNLSNNKSLTHKNLNNSNTFKSYYSDNILDKNNTSISLNNNLNSINTRYSELPKIDTYVDELLDFTDNNNKIEDTIKKIRNYNIKSLKRLNINKKDAVNLILMLKDNKFFKYLPTLAKNIIKVIFINNYYIL